MTDDDLIRAGRAWTANVADGNLTQALAAMRAALQPKPTPQAEPTDGLRIALDALDEIALAGMSGTGEESEEGMRARHARQAWAFIGIAARAKSAIAALPAPAVAAPVQPLTDAQIVDGYCKAPHTQQYVSAFVAGARFAERAHGITATPAKDSHE